MWEDRWAKEEIGVCLRLGVGLRHVLVGVPGIGGRTAWHILVDGVVDCCCGGGCSSWWYLLC